MQTTPPAPEDHLACQRLLNDFAWLQDHGDSTGFSCLFAPEGRWLRPGRAPLIGREAILANARETFRSPGDNQRLLHCITNTRMDREDAGTIRATSYSTAYQDFLEPGASGDALSPKVVPVSVMIYRNVFLRSSAGGWRILEHRSDYVFRA